MVCEDGRNVRARCGAAIGHRLWREAVGLGGMQGSNMHSVREVGWLMLSDDTNRIIYLTIFTYADFTCTAAMMSLHGRTVLKSLLGQEQLG